MIAYFLNAGMINRISGYSFPLIMPRGTQKRGWCAGTPEFGLRVRALGQEWFPGMTSTLANWSLGSARVSTSGGRMHARST